MNVFPPEGVGVIISNDTVTVTNQAVDIATANGDGDEDTADEVGEEDAGDEEEDISENE